MYEILEGDSHLIDDENADQVDSGTGCGDEKTLFALQNFLKNIIQIYQLKWKN